MQSPNTKLRDLVFHSLDIIKVLVNSIFVYNLLNTKSVYIKYSIHGDIYTNDVSKLYHSELYDIMVNPIKIIKIETSKRCINTKLSVNLPHNLMPDASDLYDMAVYINSKYIKGTLVLDSKITLAAHTMNYNILNILSIKYETYNPQKHKLRN